MTLKSDSHFTPTQYPQLRVVVPTYRGRVRR